MRNLHLVSLARTLLIFTSIGYALVYHGTAASDSKNGLSRPTPAVSSIGANSLNPGIMSTSGVISQSRVAGEKQRLNSSLAFNSDLNNVSSSVIESGAGELQDREHPAAPPSVEILGTQRLKIQSSIVGQEYELDINLPRNYKDTTRRFPVIYLLDSQWDFPLVNAVFGGQYYDGFVPELIIVGITWGGKNPNYDSLRARDYTPTTIQQLPYSGNGPKFLAFIKKELIPFVESKYRTVKDDRGLMGSSLGGLFTLYAMFHETALFNRYILTSPTLGWDKDTTFTYEQNYAGKNKRLPIRLFMGIGGLEPGIPQFQKFVDQLKGRKYEGLNLQTWVMEGMGHSGSKPEGYARGLQAMFPRPALKIDHAILDSYAGKYQMNPQVTLTISREDDNLVLLAPGGIKVKLDAETKNDFYLKGTYLFLKFERDDKGKVTGLHAEQFEGAVSLKRVE